MFCGPCESRLIIHYSTNRSGATYPYFVCVGRHQKRTDCTMSAVNIHEVERQIETLYKLVVLTPAAAARTKTHLRTVLKEGSEAAKRTQKELLNQQARLTERSKKLLDGHLEGTIPSQLYREEQERINRDMAVISDRLDALQTEFDALEQNLDDAMALIENCYEAYMRAPDSLRRAFNQAFFKRILITRDEGAEGELAEPFATIMTATQNTSGASPNGEAPHMSGSYKVSCSKETNLVDLRGFEPLTSSLRTKRATNCATGPNNSTTLSRSLPRPGTGVIPGRAASVPPNAVAIHAEPMSEGGRVGLRRWRRDARAGGGRAPRSRRRRHTPCRRRATPR